jgi:hypothetical protein
MIFQILWILISSILPLPFNAYCTGDISPQEYDALNALYVATNGSQWRWTNLDQTSKWVFPSDYTAPCSDHWEGIICTNSSGGLESFEKTPSHSPSLFLDQLSQPRKQMASATPRSKCVVSALLLQYRNLDGYIPEQIGNLTHLIYLFLYSNRIIGTIPSEIGNIGALQVLSLYENNITGSIPSELGKNIKLKEIAISNCRISGTIPPEIGNITGLRILFLYENSITGSIPSEMGRMQKDTLFVQ